VALLHVQFDLLDEPVVVLGRDVRAALAMDDLHKHLLGV
jgi:hypothetical protein